MSSICAHHPRTKACESVTAHRLTTPANCLAATLSPLSLTNSAHTTSAHHSLYPSPQISPKVWRDNPLVGFEAHATLMHRTRAINDPNVQRTALPPRCLALPSFSRVSPSIAAICPAAIHCFLLSRHLLRPVTGPLSCCGPTPAHAREPQHSYLLHLCPLLQRVNPKNTNLRSFFSHVTWPVCHCVTPFSNTGLENTCQSAFDNSLVGLHTLHRITVPPRVGSGRSSQ